MQKILNITNGDAAAEIIKQSPLQGDVLPWRDPLHHGPCPAGLDLESLSSIRAEYLADNFGNAAETIKNFRLRDEQLCKAEQYDKIIFWFEHDLLDQLQLMQLLDWFASRQRMNCSLQMICIDSCSGIQPFRGLGQLSVEQIESLYDCQQPVTREQCELAAEGWLAFRSADPTDLLSFARKQLEALSFLQPALLRHLKEFPWSKDGLTQTERQILKLIDSGITNPRDVFLQNMELESVLFIGDWETYRRIELLCANELIGCRPNNRFVFSPKAQISAEDFHKQQFSLTDKGKKAVAGQLDCTSVICCDEWLGGVNLQPGLTLWMWDEEADQMLFREI
jgi:hypothetical protein